MLEHRELVRENAKSFDFVTPDDKLHEMWQSMGVAVLGMALDLAVSHGKAERRRCQPHLVQGLWIPAATVSFAFLESAQSCVDNQA